MARTFIRQDTQIQSSDVYDDTIAPTEAAFETNPTHIETDLNNIRSMLSHLLDVQVGNWWDTITTPSTLESGTQRGVSDLNDALHLVEKKRVLRCVHNLTDVTVPAAAFASGSIVAVAKASLVDQETFTLDDGVNTPVVFEFDLPPDGITGGNVLVDVSADTTDVEVASRMVSAINGAASLNLTASNAGGTSATVTIVNDVAGTQGNVTTWTDTVVNAGFVITQPTGGAGDVLILNTGELPANTTAAVGAVTTLGTVVAYEANFGTATTTEVSGISAISPKNLMTIVDGDTRDPLLSGGRKIWGLLQSETVTDGHTISDTTPTRVQISFVRINAAGDDLELVPASDIAGTEINYCSAERVRLEDLNEADFLSGAVIDVPAASTVTRQVAYDNQGTTPVDLTTNATLDLEGAGLIWAIRDDLEASLFRIIEGSAGGTSEIEFGADVDTFDNNAVVNDFANGLRVDTTGERIDIGETAGTIESTGANDLRIYGALELFLDDSNQTGSTWAQTDGIKLSETTQEWDDFETRFGEVSLLNAIIQADQGATRTKVQSVVTVTSVADTNTNGPILGGAANLSVNLPAYDQVTFVTDVDVFFNGSLLRNGADAAANEDVYPGTTPSQGDLKFEFTIKASPGLPDVITVVVYGQ